MYNAHELFIYICIYICIDLIELTLAHLQYYACRLTGSVPFR